MKVLLVFVFVLFLTSSQNNDVYVCVSKTAHKYHFTKSCRGLRACTHEIVKKSLKEAQGLGYTLCGYED